MYVEMSGWNPLDIVKNAVGTVFGVPGAAVKTAVEVSQAVPQVPKAVLTGVASNIPGVGKAITAVPMTVIEPIISDTIATTVPMVTAPLIKAEKFEPIVLPGYKKTAEGKVVKETNIKDWLSMIPLSGLAYLAFAL